MIYFIITALVTCFFIGYMTGSERGYRKAHQKIVTNQLKRRRQPPVINTGETSSHARKLRLVKKDNL